MSKKIIDRIRKLLALSQDKANVHEAALAAQRAQELMLRYKISRADLRHQQSSVGELNLPISPFEKKAGIPQWREILLSGIARVNSCTVLFGSEAVDFQTLVIGDPMSTNAVLYIYEYLVKQIEELSKKPIGEEVDKGVYRGSLMDFLMNNTAAFDPEDRTEAWLTGFKIGAAREVVSRLKQQKLKFTNHYQQDGKALVLYRDEAAVRDYLKEHYPGTPTEDIGAPPPDATKGHHTGQKAAGQINLDPPERAIPAPKPQLEE